MFGSFVLNRNSKYQDLFAAGMGSCKDYKHWLRLIVIAHLITHCFVCLVFLPWLDDFGRQRQGLLLFYTLKDSSCPEYIYPTTSAVQCLDIHHQLTHLVAVGFYDGCVAVYNLKKGGKEPVYKSTSKTGKHTDPVWQVTAGGDSADVNKFRMCLFG